MPQKRQQKTKTKTKNIKKIKKRRRGGKDTQKKYTKMIFMTQIIMMV